VFPLKTGLLPIKERFQKWGDSVSEKVSRNVFFGPDNRNLNAIIHAIKENRGRVSAGNAANYLDVALHNPAIASYREGLTQQSAYKPVIESERFLRQVGSYMLASRIAVAHASQWVNSINNSGLKAFSEGIFDLVKDRQGAIEFAYEGGSMYEELRREMEISIRGGESRLKRALHQPGFGWVRKQLKITSAVIGKHEAEDAALQLLRNPTNRDAAIVLGKLHIDPNDVIQNKGLTQNMKDTAGYFAADRDVFFNESGTPFKWQGTPSARLRTMYKPFSFRMSKMIKDTLVKDLERGGTDLSSFKKGITTLTPQSLFNVTKTLATLGTLFPVVGELIVLTENQILGRQDKPFETDTPFTEKWKQEHSFLDQYLNAIAHVGGFGIAYSMFRGMSHRMLSNFVLGPVESSTLDFAGDVGKAIWGTPSGKHDFTPVLRDVMRKVPIVGPGLTRQFIPSKKKEPSFKSSKKF
jgi:hypothetical protein